MIMTQSTHAPWKSYDHGSLHMPLHQCPRFTLRHVQLLGIGGTLHRLWLYWPCHRILWAWIGVVWLAWPDCAVCVSVTRLTWPGCVAMASLPLIHAGTEWLEECAKAAAGSTSKGVIGSCKQEASVSQPISWEAITWCYKTFIPSTT